MIPQYVREPWPVTNDGKKEINLAFQNDPKKYFPDEAYIFVDIF